ncbi:MAG TPA: glycosyltransferase family 2 protein [Acidimicrobiales bacterium]|nr:glycosyltransferase family 2 protein [Acidimicrobiales bacterium]
MDPELTVSMITLNEERAVEKVIRSVKAVVPDAEVLMVDSSTDSTAEIAESLGARVIKQFPPIGYGPAMDVALRSSSGSVVVTLDCDDTYPAERIPELRDLVLREGWDVVDGCRLPRKPQAMPLVNYLANWSVAALASVLFARRLRDLHSGMRAYRKTVIDGLSYDPKGAALPVELLLRPLKEGRRVHTVPIEYRYRIGESTMRPVESLVWTLRRMFRARFS